MGDNLEKGLCRKKIIQDLILNIISSFIVTAILQIMVYPILSDKISDSLFGSVLTLTGLSNALGVMFGSSLNNIQLLNQNKYNTKSGNYGILLKYTNLIVILLSIVIGFLFIKSIMIGELIIFIFIPLLTMLRAYMNIYYRLNLDYKNIFLHMLSTGLGYIVGLFLYSLINMWTIIFFTGELFAFIFAYLTTDFKKREKCKDENYMEIKNQYIQLVGANSVSNLLTYLDRFIINPILGANNVSLYFIASIVGKVVGIVLQPLSSIILTYISKLKNINERKLFTLIITIVGIFGIGIFMLTIYITPIVIKILYKDSFEAVKQYFNIANLSAILMVMGSLIQPLILKYCPMWWQGVIQSIYTLIYVVLGIIMMRRNGLQGFGIVAVLANLVRIAFLIFVGYYYLFIKNKNNICIEKYTFK